MLYPAVTGVKSAPGLGRPGAVAPGQPGRGVWAGRSPVPTLMHRLALVVVLAVLGGVSLAGCRSEPAVAAYLGATKITVAEVSAVVSSVNAVADRRAALRAQALADRLAAIDAGKAPDDYPDVSAEVNRPTVRTDARSVLGLIYFNAIADRLVAERGLTVEVTDPSVVAGAFGLSSGDRFVQLYAAFYSKSVALLRSVPAAEVTDHDTQRYAEALYDSGVASQDFPFEQAVQRIKADPRQEIQHFTVVRALDDVAATAGATVNPRFAPVPVPLIYFGRAADGSTVAVPMSLSANAASDVPVEEA